MICIARWPREFSCFPVQTRMPPPSVAGREELIQRCILTAIGDVHLVDRAHAVLTQRTVGSITITRNCSTMISTHTPCVAQLTLVLQHEDALDYEQIAACIDERIASLDCLSGRASKLLRCAPLSIRTVGPGIPTSTNVLRVRREPQVLINGGDAGLRLVWHRVQL